MHKKLFSKKNFDPKNLEKRDFWAKKSWKNGKIKNFCRNFFCSESIQNVLKRILKQKSQNRNFFEIDLESSKTYFKTKMRISKFFVIANFTGT